jgi:hypothetical protein
VNRQAVTIAAAGSGAGLMLACAVWLALPQSFTSTATVSITWQPEVSRYLDDLKIETLSKATIAPIVVRHSLYPNEIAVMPMEDVVQLMRRDIGITAVRLTDSAEKWIFSFRYPGDSAKAAVARSDLMAAFTTAAARPRRRGDLPVFSRLSANALRADYPVPITPGRAATDRFCRSLYATVLGPEGLAQIIARLNFYEGNAAAAVKVRRSIRIMRSGAQANEIRLSYQHSDATMAQSVLRAVVTGMLETTRARPEGPVIRVEHAPTLPRDDEGPSLLWVAICGVTDGAVLGWMLWMRLFHTRRIKQVAA